MKAQKNVPIFRLRSTRGFTHMRDLWRWAFFLSQHLPHEVRVEGVTHVRTQNGQSAVGMPPITSDSRTRTHVPIMPKPQPFHFRKRRGFATRDDLARYDAHLREFFQPLFSSDNIFDSNQDQSRITLGPLPAEPLA